MGTMTRALKAARTDISVLGLFILANITNSLTTSASLASGGVEANPIISMMMAQFGVSGALTLKVLIATLAGLALYRRGRIGMLTVLTVGLVLISLANAANALFLA